MCGFGNVSEISLDDNPWSDFDNNLDDWGYSEKSHSYLLNVDSRSPTVMRSNTISNDLRINTTNPQCSKNNSHLPKELTHIISASKGKLTQKERKYLGSTLVNFLQSGLLTWSQLSNAQIIMDESIKSYIEQYPNRSIIFDYALHTMITTDVGVFSGLTAKLFGRPVDIMTGPVLENSATRKLGMYAGNRKNISLSLTANHFVLALPGGFPEANSSNLSKEDMPRLDIHGRRKGLFWASVKHKRPVIIVIPIGVDYTFDKINRSYTDFLANKLLLPSFPVPFDLRGESRADMPAYFYCPKRIDPAFSLDVFNNHKDHVKLEKLFITAFKDFNIDWNQVKEFPPQILYEGIQYMNNHKWPEPVNIPGEDKHILGDHFYEKDVKNLKFIIDQAKNSLLSTPDLTKTLKDIDQHLVNHLHAQAMQEIQNENWASQDLQKRLTGLQTIGERLTKQLGVKKEDHKEYSAPWVYHRLHELKISCEQYKLNFQTAKSKDKKIFWHKEYLKEYKNYEELREKYESKMIEYTDRLDGQVRDEIYPTSTLKTNRDVQLSNTKLTSDNFPTKPELGALEQQIWSVTGFKIGHLDLGLGDKIKSGLQTVSDRITGTKPVDLPNLPPCPITKVLAQAEWAERVEKKMKKIDQQRETRTKQITFVTKGEAVAVAGLACIGYCTKKTVEYTMPHVKKHVIPYIKQVGSSLAGLFGLVR